MGIRDFPLEAPALLPRLNIREGARARLTSSSSFPTRNQPRQRPHLPDRELSKLRKALLECGAVAYNPK